MIPEHEREFRKLLRWYPRWWRTRHGAVVLGTMLDEAEQQGRADPTASARASAIVHGLGTRLDARMALRCAIAALALAAAAGFGSFWAVGGWATADVAWVYPALTVFLCPVLLTVSGISLARQRFLVSAPLALAIVTLAVPTLALASLTQISWGLSFDAADLGVPSKGLAAAWPWLFGAAWTLGSLAIALFVDALLRLTPLHRALSGAFAAVAGLMVTPVLGLSLVTPYFSAFAAASLALFALVPPRAKDAASRNAPPAPAAEVADATAHPPRTATAHQPTDIGTPTVPLRTRRLARRLAWITAVTSTVGVVFALSGSLWLPGGAADATAVMGQGITLSLTSALPLLAAIGLFLAPRSRTRSVHVWWPLALVALSLGAVAVAYLGGPSWDGMVLGFVAGAILGGAALAWWLIPRLRGTPVSRATVGVLIGVGYAAIAGILVAPMLAFALPLLAAAIAIWGPRPPRALAPVHDTGPRLELQPTV